MSGKATLHPDGRRMLKAAGEAGLDCVCCEETCCFVPPPEVDVTFEFDPYLPVGNYVYDSSFPLPSSRFTGTGTAHKYIGVGGDADGINLVIVRRCSESLVVSVACCSTVNQVAEFRWYVEFEDTCDPEFCGDTSGTFYHPIDDIEMFYCEGYIFDGGGYIQWDNDYSEEWSEEVAPGCLPDPMRQAWYDTCEGSGGGGAEPIIIPVSLVAGLYHGTIDGTTACWQIFDTPALDPTRCVEVGDDLVPIESCEDELCASEECAPDADSNFKYTLAYCIDPSTAVAEIITNGVYALGTVLVDAVDAPPPRFIVIACADGGMVAPGPPFTDYLMNTIFPNGILDTMAGCP